MQANNYDYDYEFKIRSWELVSNPVFIFIFSSIKL